MCRLALLDLCDGRGRDQRSEDQYGEASLHRSLSLIELLLTSSLMSVCILVLRMRAVNQPHVPPARSQKQPHGTKTHGQLGFFRLAQQQATECLRPGTSVWPAQVAIRFFTKLPTDRRYSSRSVSPRCRMPPPASVKRSTRRGSGISSTSRSPLRTPTRPLQSPSWARQLFGFPLTGALEQTFGSKSRDNIKRPS